MEKQGGGKGTGRQAGQGEESPAREVSGDADVGAGGPGRRLYGTRTTAAAAP